MGASLAGRGDEVRQGAAQARFKNVENVKWNKKPRKKQKNRARKKESKTNESTKKLKETKRSFNLIEEKLPQGPTKVVILMKQRRYY